MSDKFYCQRCNNPLTLHSSLLGLNTVQANLLKDKSNPQLNHYIKRGDELDDEDDDILDPNEFISQDRLDFYNETSNPTAIPLTTRKDSLSSHKNPVTFLTSLTLNSFVMLSENEDEKDHEANGTPDQHIEGEGHAGTISNRIHILSKVFEILSANTEVDHPLCQECLSLIIENYKLKFDQSQKEKDYYLTFLKKLRDQGEQIGDEEAEVDPKLSMAIKECRRLQEEEKTKLEELKVLESTKSQLDDQLKELQQELNLLKTTDLKELLHTQNDLALELDAGMGKLDQAKAQYQNHLNHLDKLRSLNIYNQFFDISCDTSNSYATINGFRLGYKVPWSEVNMALGQVMLLMVFLVKRLDLHLKEYKLVPMGSHSHIVKLSEDENGQMKKTILNLYSSNEFSLGKLFNFNKFDVSMIALLEVLVQVQRQVKKLDPEFVLPYKISSKRDQIGGKSIRVTSNGEWTDSCRFMLTNLNWVLKYTSAHTS